MIAIADLRDVCGVTAGDTTYDARLTALEAEAVAWVQRRTLRYFEAEASVTERLRGNGTPILRLAEAPSTDPTEVLEYAYVGATAATITGADASGFEVVKRVLPDACNVGSLERKGGCVWVCDYLYVVTYERGYNEIDAGPPADIAAPDDIRALVKEMVRLRYYALAREAGLISETIGNYSYSTGAVYSQDDALINQIPGARETIARWARRVYA